MSFPDRHILAAWQLLPAVFFPVFVIAFEAVTGYCADSIFDPLPTPGHLVLVSLVPLVNWLLWRGVWREQSGPKWLPFAAGAAIAISASYALLFVPVMPIALVGILFMGIGLLPFAPFLTLIFAVRWSVQLSEWQPHMARNAALGAVLGLTLLTAVDLPATVTYLALKDYGDSETAAPEAVGLMRTLGDKDVLLRLAYGDSARATGLISYLVSSWGRTFDDDSMNGSTAARELYFRATGTPFNAVPPPDGESHGPRRWMDRWDGDQGGETVGGRVEGLALDSSRIDGAIAPADNLGYFEWTMEVRNRAPLQHEARLTLALPQGAVASRATLWINGEPREASIAGRGAARAAYANVVRAQRDPLLVTTDGAQRLLVQAFPIPPGGTIKFRVGYTTPFAVAADGSRSLALPAIVERNFEIAPAFGHNVWIEGDARLGGMLRGTLHDDELLARRPRITAERLSSPLVSTGTVPAQDKAPPIAVTQTIAPQAPVSPPALLLVVDGSASDAEAAHALRTALDALPAGLPVGLWIAADTPVVVATQPWSGSQRTRVDHAISHTGFVGGQDNLPQLTAALAANPGATLVWIHGPQPVEFARTRAALDQFLERSTRLPRLIRYQRQPGRAFTINGNPWFETAREVTPSGDASADLRALLREAAGAAPAWTATRVEGGSGRGSAHLVRLWAADRIAADMAVTGKGRDERIALAQRLNLITPLSGAVVLEAKRAYKDNDLPVPGAEDVPTVPEPGTWALLAIVLLVAGWLLRRARKEAALRPAIH